MEDVLLILFLLFPNALIEHLPAVRKMLSLRMLTENTRLSESIADED
jgi:hypothetical protein